MTLPRLVAILGSGELAPGMVSQHRAILARVPGDASRVLLDTPFGFQENADWLTERIQEHFLTRLDCRLDVAGLRDGRRASAVERERFAAAIDGAGFVFAGPGSPSYAVHHWRGTPLADQLRRKVRGGGVLVFASAAAIALGRWAVPVYEIYKVGEAPHWIDGLDVLSEAGIRCAVVPHFDNTEGGNHDTRFCYLGERRMQALEAMLEPGALVLGVDEHTAVVIDLDDGVVRVSGRGALTLSRDGVRTVVTAGDEIGVDALRGARDVPASASSVAAVVSRARAGARSARESGGPAAQPRPDRGPSARIADLCAAIDEALANRAADGAVAGLLELDSLAAAGTVAADEARSALRRRIVRLGDLARDAAAGGAREHVAPFVDALVSLRGIARDEQRFDDADRVRAMLTACGVEVRDTHDGAEWRLHEPAE